MINAFSLRRALKSFFEDYHTSPAHLALVKDAPQPRPIQPPHIGEDEEEEPETARSVGELNLYHLTIRFLGYLRRLEGVSYAKGELGRREVYRFILERHDGKLEYRESMLESMQRDMDRQRGRPSPPKRKSKPCEHVLVPDAQRLEHYPAGLLEMMNQLYYRAAALFGIIPPWLRFLETRRLIDAEARE